MTWPIQAAVIVACAAVTVAAFMHAWKSWVTVGTEHTWTEPVNRLAARITGVERRLTELEDKP